MAPPECLKIRFSSCRFVLQQLCSRGTIVEICSSAILFQMNNCSILFQKPNRNFCSTYFICSQIKDVSYWNYSSIMFHICCTNFYFFLNQKICSIRTNVNVIICSIS
ncbi:hypothetical protein PVAP13_9KG032554 [Panicum virgatum]|uniref:Uncharacterized protein n=1 Tax=Panicum virgatum TaxID=38727 RepID=A0A8T0NHV4_PANVG|nr:hypothetical protein PVAP13_9KG032554 [Panicum virgatum]